MSNNDRKSTSPPLENPWSAPDPRDPDSIAGHAWADSLAERSKNPEAAALDKAAHEAYTALTHQRTEDYEKAKEEIMARVMKNSDPEALAMLEKMNARVINPNTVSQDRIGEDYSYPEPSTTFEQWCNRPLSKAEKKRRLEGTPSPDPKIKDVKLPFEEDRDDPVKPPQVQWGTTLWRDTDRLSERPWMKGVSKEEYQKVLDQRMEK